jgi:D-arabinose 1-dehydrogenase-like Zn-dependent alcohol dehydrogenase
VQIAKVLGAEVTAVCSASKLEMVRAIGANRVFTRDAIKSQLDKNYYDVILDTAAYNSIFDYLPLLKPQGRYVLVGGSTARLFGVMFFSILALYATIIGSYCSTRFYIAYPG